MEPRESIKDDVVQEFKYILHSQKIRNEIPLVGNLRSIQCSITYPFFQHGKLLNYKISFNIVLCLLSNGTIVPPLVLDTTDELTRDNETPALKVKSINFTQFSFRSWLKSVWRKRCRLNIRSLLVTSSHLPSRAAELLKKYNTELIILPDIIAADTEPLNEMWCNEFMSEINNRFKICNQEFSTTTMLPMEMLCKMVYSAWIKCSRAASFDKLLLLDKGREIADILEDELILQRQWTRKPNFTMQKADQEFEIMEVLYCSLCHYLLHDYECGSHALTEITTHRRREMFLGYTRLIGIGNETYFTCFKQHDSGKLICLICAQIFSEEYFAAHHIHKHLQQKWCRICLRQIFVCQEHTCPENDPEEHEQEEGIPASENRYLESNPRTLPEVSSIDTSKWLLAQHKGAGVGNVSNDLEGLTLIEKQSSKNSKNFSLNVHTEVCNSDVQSCPVPKRPKFVDTETHRNSEHNDENTYTSVLKSMSLPDTPLYNTTNRKTSQNNTGSNSFVCDIQAKSSSEDVLNSSKEADHNAMYFKLLEFTSENEDYFMDENVSNECSIPSHFFYTPDVSMEETSAGTNSGPL